ncbi:MAG: hypothetical protein A2600_10315 [Candidatus Lambdaproteobacteria bacterium RIFOXYD1_FULL_56_27]|uniref:Cation-transporting P-type ATPase N-terminal domain-containing protein n=1 Tax=Candidatus Lambdaproteobacteria bacterium RIFOXYD2_FULL_56_26 TaxID=1817773 RepID=A0A1F6GQG7_9PROT|nr:MAG: hypothetical protein A2557_09370 [Candidatus Lambdaproteobacteria bacterium RIFOXYD2_FULL_56_26]OGH04140.1 MAG: hypothetical protein A2426_02760 [Candidatus Lambdaproteobacteria bacterium RIFOXYC1_FULL_56_13]OGH06343.1 MAG: hypothetical protein A2600_10315 [Candidatus Lambdaproteobacteria bacterium RIFOXYD1_FULL_56_27]
MSILQTPAQAWHCQTSQEAAQALKSDPKLGLTEETAAQRLEAYGPNQLEAKGTKSAFLMLFEQFTSLLILILIAAAAVSGYLGQMVEMGAILAIVVLFGILGFVQEYRADQALAALKKLSVPRAFVCRSGVWRDLDSSELVPGDLVRLEAGSFIPADLRMTNVQNFQIDESALTGESLPVAKEINPIQDPDAPLGNRKNMAFMGTFSLLGRAEALVAETGMNTEIGRIAKLLQTAESGPTPLQRRLDQAGKVLAIVGAVASLLVMIVGLWLGRDLAEMFLIGVSLAVAVVPEGLPAVVTITLALGARRMLKRHSLVRKLTAVETLGSVTVICSDKTGTLTQNKMTADLMRTALDGTPGEGLAKRRLGLAGVLCNDAAWPLPQVGGEKLAGDPTEIAFLEAALKEGLDPGAAREKAPRVAEWPFDSGRKMMSTLHELSQDGELWTQVLGSLEGGRLLVAKGAGDMLLDRCTSQVGPNGPEPLGPKELAFWHQEIDRLAAVGRRVLGVAAKKAEPGLEQGTAEQAESNLVFLGLTGMIDPPRPEAAAAVVAAKRAGIRPVMITGDHPATAKAIAHELGLEGEALRGDELAKMSDEELKVAVGNVAIFARVSPEQKLRIVKAYQDRGEVVSMTGDGVNDSPSLKQADIGVAMGMAGTDTAKEAASMVLLDDNFATIVAAVEEGRTIYDNILRFLRFSITGNMGKVLVMLTAPLFGMTVALVPLQLLWLNLLTDGLLSVGLGVEAPEANVMHRPPRPPKASVFGGGMPWFITIAGGVLGLISLALGVYYFRLDPAENGVWQTMIFTSIVFLQIAQALSARSIDQSCFTLSPATNKLLFYMIGLTLVLQLAVMYLPPLAALFEAVPLGSTELGLCIGSGVFYLVFLEIYKKLAPKPKTI